MTDLHNYQPRLAALGNSTEDQEAEADCRSRRSHIGDAYPADMESHSFRSHQYILEASMVACL